MSVQIGARATKKAKAASTPDRSGWVRCTPEIVENLPVQVFPWKVKPDLFAPDTTILSVSDKTGTDNVYAFLWCYLSREVKGSTSSYDPASKSTLRVEALPKALGRLSKHFTFKGIRAQSVQSGLGHLGRFLNWADDPKHEGVYEAVLSDPDVALKALKAHHTHLRHRLQSHQISPFTAGKADQTAIALLSEIHDRVYANDIEPLAARKGQGTKAPQQEDVAQMGQMLQAVFDSAARLVLDPDAGPVIGTARRIRVGDGNDDSVALDKRYSTLKLAELACIAYAGLAFMDSGANWAVLQSYEEPDDLEDQLADPDRINLTQKAIKFRAGGKPVEVFLSAQTVTRIRTFMQVRKALVDSVASSTEGGVGDITPLFVQGRYDNRGKYADPTRLGPLDRNFLEVLRDRIKALGTKKRPAELPRVTLMQLRAYKQQDLVRRAPVAIAAKVMGHSVETAIKAYCKAQEATKHGEMAGYLTSLRKTVLEASEASSEGIPGTKVIPLTAIPVGACADHGHPSALPTGSPSSSTPPVQPDCSKPQGCFFCDKYRLHAEEADIKKLLSCRRVLGPIASLAQDSLAAHKVYQAVVDRVDSLLEELQRRAPEAFEAARVDVVERGNLTPYFARKVSQLGLLQMLTQASKPENLKDGQ